MIQREIIPNPRLKMRELRIFRRSQLLGDNITLHVDDMDCYNSWFLIEHHDIERIIFRGHINKLNDKILQDIGQSKEALQYALTSIGSPEKILITYTTKDTY